MRIGLYGGSFDPIHNGHLIIARAAAERLGLDRVIFLPSATPPHKSGERLAEPGHRAEMVRLAIADEPGFAFSDFDMTRSGPSYTIDTVAHFRETLGSSADLHWLIGADSLAELTTWYRVESLVDSCRLVTVARTGGDPVCWDHLRSKLSALQIERLKEGVLDTPLIEVSSTDIRHRARQGLSIRYLVPDAVERFIGEKRLYQESR